MSRPALVLALLLLLALAALGDDRKPELVGICESCGEVGTGKKCPNDDDRLIESRLVVFHRALAYLSKHPGPTRGANPFEPVRGEDGRINVAEVRHLLGRYCDVAAATSFSPWRSPFPPPYLEGKRACPRCFKVAAGTECPDDDSPLVRSSLVTFHCLVQYLATLSPRERLENPFARLGRADGSLDPDELERLGADYEKAIPRLGDLTDAESSVFPLAHAVTLHDLNVTPIEILGQIAKGQERYRRDFASPDGAHVFGDLAELTRTLCVDSPYLENRRHGFDFVVKPSSAEPDKKWFATATPAAPTPGDRYYFTDQTGEVRSGYSPFVVNEETCEAPKGLAVSRGAPSPLAIPRSEEEREATAVGSLRALEVAQLVYRDGRAGKGCFASVEKLRAAKLLPNLLGTGRRLGWTFRGGPATRDPKSRFWLLAAPLGPEVSKKTLYLDVDGKVLAGPTVTVDEENARPSGDLEEVTPRRARDSMPWIPQPAEAWATFGVDRHSVNPDMDLIEATSTALQLDGERMLCWDRIAQARLRLSWGFEGKKDALTSCPLLAGAIHASERSIAFGATPEEVQRRKAQLGKMWLTFARVGTPTLEEEVDRASRAIVALSVGLVGRQDDEWLVSDLADAFAFRASRVTGEARKVDAVAALELVEESLSKPKSSRYRANLASAAEAHVLLGHHAQGFLALSESVKLGPRSSREWRNPHVGIAAVASAASRVAFELRDLVGQTTDEARKELELARGAKERLIAEAKGFEKAAKDCPKRFKAGFLAAAARVARFVEEDATKARTVYEAAIAVAEGEEKGALEKERDELRE